MKWALLRFLLCCLGSAWLASGAQAAEPRPFSVGDSIGIARFTVPSPDDRRQVPLFSPDGRYFVVVTQRGNVQADTLESTLWLFDARALGNARDTNPNPLATLSGGTVSMDNNEGLLTLRALRWSDDSKSLLFLGRDGGTDWRLFSVDTDGGTLRQLTPAGQNVGCFAQRGSLIAYSVAPHRLPPSTAPVVVATGRSIASLLFPDEDLSDWHNREELWLLKAGKPVPVFDPHTREPVYLKFDLYDPGSDVLSLSPDGHRVILTAAVDAIPRTWRDYEPGYPTWRIEPAGSQVVKYKLMVPERFVAVDLQTGESTYPVDAPLGRSVGWVRGPTRAIWESDSRSVILVNTFLPLEGVDKLEWEHRVRGPVIVEYNVHTRKVAEIAAVRESSGDQTARWGIADLDWQSSNGELTITYGVNGPGPERYRRKGQRWVVSPNPGPSPARLASPPPRDALHVSVQQDLNSPPALFASVGDAGTSRMIWSPNPQLQSGDLSTARKYDWVDGQGREVKGVLFLPVGYESGKRYPLVIEARSYSQDRFVIDGTYSTAVAARAMAAAGLMVLQAGEPALRRDDFFSKELGASLEGYAAAIDTLHAAGLIDPHRVGIIGFSRTCANVLYALTKQPHLFAAATLANGIVYGFSQYLFYLDYGDNNMANKQYHAVYGGPPFGSHLAAYAQDNPIFNLDRVAAPVRVETHSPANLLFDWETYAGLHALGKPVDLIMLPNASHVVSMPSDLVQSQQGDVDWFRFWLQGYEDSDPAKAEQYRRWESLCSSQVAADPERAPACVSERD